MISVREISKTYDKTNTALSSISLEVSQGQLFGLIGPDGSGKTSLFRILATLLLPDKGEATVAGHDIKKNYREIRSSLGYMPGKFSLYQDLSVEENLNFFATVFNTTIEENYHLIKDIYVQLEPFKNRRAARLSGGMKQKLALCCALIHKPKVLLLDEPTTGVDPVSRKEFWDMLVRLKEQNITILVSTPYMDEAARCDRIALIQKGELLKIANPSEIVNSFSEQLVAIRGGNVPALLQLLRSSHLVRRAYTAGQHIKAVIGSQDKLADLKSLLTESKISHEAELTDPDIEDCFIELMKDDK